MSSQTLNNSPSRPLKDDEYFDSSTNLIKCKVCNTPKQIPLYDGTVLKDISCDCEMEAITRERELLEFQQFKNKFKKNLGQRFINANFKNTLRTNDSFNNALLKCEDYCNNYIKNKDEGLGLFLFGGKGVGKTRLLACIVNDLLDKYQTCLFTNIYEISERIRECFNSRSSEYDLIQELNQVDFLLIDDLGTELVQKNNNDTWLQEKLFEIVNRRYLDLKPIIYSSNYSLNDLVNKRGIADKTIDRVVESSKHIIEIKGESFRR